MSDVTVYFPNIKDTWELEVRWYRVLKKYNGKMLGFGRDGSGILFIMCSVPAQVETIVRRELSQLNGHV